ncbi:MAG TPA: carboxypeptidase-like regulatory domain-containing protein, partial [Micromonosporaceae bacterium]
MALATVASLVGIGLAAQPALAASAGVTVSVSPSSVTLSPGQSATVNVAVTNTGEDDGTPMAATLAVSGGSASASDITVGLASGCDNTGQSQAGQATCMFTSHTSPPPGQDTANLVFTLKAAQSISDVVPGGKATFSSSSVSVVESPAINSPVSKGFSLTLNGPAPPPPSTISGVVDDITTGQPVANALVNLQDSASHTYLGHSNSSGKFSFTAGGSTPVVAGPVVIGASKKGYQDFTGAPKTFTPGQDLTGWRVLIKPAVVATPSASASATPSASASSAE